MKTNHALILVAVFSIAILLSQTFLIMPTAQAIAFEYATLGGSSAISIDRNCDYLSSTKVFCPTGVGAKMWNPTTRTLLFTVNASSSITDVKCGLLCYVWVASGITGVLTSYTTSGVIVNSTTFTGGAGSTTGVGIGIATASGAENIFLPVEGQTCTGAVGGTDEKGICVWDGIAWSGARFITTSCTSDACVNWDSEWNAGTATVGNPSGNRLLVKNQDAIGNHRYYLLNLADADTTFSTTEVCNTGVVAGGFNIQAQAQIIDQILYDFINNDLWTFDTALNTCSEQMKTNIVDESIARGLSYSSTDDLFFVQGNTDGAFETTSVNVFNGTTFDLGDTLWTKELKLNTTIAGAGNFNWASWVHQTEGELHVWQGSSVLIITDLLTEIGEDSPSTGGLNCDLPENANILICRLGGDGTLGSAGAFVIGNTTDGTGVLGIGCSIGLVDCTEDPNPQTNGLGLLIFLASLFVIIGMFFRTLGANATFTMPVYIWAVIILALSAFFTITGLIDPAFLIVSIIALIALASPQIISRIRGNTFGGGGSTE